MQVLSYKNISAISFKQSQETKNNFKKENFQNSKQKSFILKVCLLQIMESC